MEKIDQWIAGIPQASSDAAVLSVFDPVTGQAYAECPRGSAVDIAAAVTAAQSAFPVWSALKASDRAQWLNRLADAIEARIEAFSRCESRDTGKPLGLVRDIEIPRAIANFRFFAGTATQSLDQSYHQEAGLNYTLHQPLGVVGVISPWNLPLYLLSWKLAPALAAGNCVIAKPSEITPMSADLLARTAQEIGFPASVLNIVQGAGETVGAALVAHPDVKAISFTGSTAVGHRIAAACADQFKKLTLEMGGKNPALVFADAPAHTLKSLVRAAFQNSGQICLCGSRILIHRDIYDDFKKAFVAESSALKIGAPSDPATQLGPVMSEAHFRKVLAYIALAKDEGGSVLCGGEAVKPEACDGWFIAPTVIEGLPMDSGFCQDEIFGPVVSLHAFDNENHALALANASRYGLAATVWTSDLMRAHRMASELECGIVWINTWMQRDLRTPFGGMKQSGFGREGGLEAMKFFTEPKTVCIGVLPNG
jgi:aminomuconate-semialdehyde/2-hydroxymuconate-6-semialdehyde dehydrogenase